jgi:hypothetical protein
VEIIRCKPDDAATLTAIAFAAKRYWGYHERWIESWSDLLTIKREYITNEALPQTDEAPARHTTSR